MKELLDQIGAALEQNLYYLALMGSLAIPDICGAMESEDGEATGARYKEWFDKYVPPAWFESEPAVTGEDCYRFRCSLLHQGSSQHERSRYSGVMFLDPRAQNVMCHRSVFISGSGESERRLLVLDIRLFCLEIICGAERWLKQSEGTPDYERNYDRFFRRRTEEVDLQGIQVTPVRGIPFIT